MTIGTSNRGTLSYVSCCLMSEHKSHFRRRRATPLWAVSSNRPASPADSSIQPSTFVYSLRPDKEDKWHIYLCTDMFNQSMHAMLTPHMERPYWYLCWSCSKIVHNTCWRFLCTPRQFTSWSSISLGLHIRNLAVLREGGSWNARSLAWHSPTLAKISISCQCCLCAGR